mmetsp:Transcript_1040/g.3389  ORF Transcript_1040/g.3389 Transcript_1040/m.3389 type:complete len:221 (+) Transcript_1040:1020-1682(+)
MPCDLCRVTTPTHRERKARGARPAITNEVVLHSSHDLFVAPLPPPPPRKAQVPDEVGPCSELDRGLALAAALQHVVLIRGHEVVVGIVHHILHSDDTPRIFQHGGSRHSAVVVHKGKGSPEDQREENHLQAEEEVTPLLRSFGRHSRGDLDNHGLVVCCKDHCLDCSELADGVEPSDDLPRGQVEHQEVVKGQGVRDVVHREHHCLVRGSVVLAHTHHDQ